MAAAPKKTTKTVAAPKTVCRAIAKWMCYAVLALLALLGLLAAWSFTTPVPEGTFFATVFPLMKGIPPQTLFGSLVRPSTPPVPADMLPLPRPAKESFVTLAGTGDPMPANGLGMCCRASAYDDESVRRTSVFSEIGPLRGETELGDDILPVPSADLAASLSGLALRASMAASRGDIAALDRATPAE